MIMKDIKELLKKEGYVLVSTYSLNDEDTYHFLHKEGLGYIRITEEGLDDEVLWSLLDISLEETKNKTEEELEELYKKKISEKEV